jgi:glycosyltransferase involved in cell wall biosynthesis
LLLASCVLRKKTIAYNGINREDVFAAYGTSGFRKKLSLFLENEAMKRADARIVTGPLLYVRYSTFGPTFMATPLSAVLQKKTDQRSPRSMGESIRLLSIAHFRKWKNLDILIRACGILRERGVRFELNVVGDGLMRPELEKLVHILGLNDCVVFHGYISDPEELCRHYRHNDILLLASQVEGFPRAVWEAIHFGLYVILAEVGGVESIFDNNDMHILKNPAPEAYADAILEISRNPEKSFASVQSAQAKFNKLFAHSPVEQFQNCLALLGNE